MKKVLYTTILSGALALGSLVPTASVHAKVDLNSVIQTYADLLFEMEPTCTDDACFGLFYLDDDDIPELYVTTAMFHMAVPELYASNGISAYSLGDFVSECATGWVDPYSGEMKGAFDGQGVESDYYYRLNGSHLELSEELTADRRYSNYKINDEFVSESEYYAAIEREEEDHNWVVIGYGAEDSIPLTLENIYSFLESYGSTSTSSSNGMIFPDSDSRIISQSEYMSLSYDELRFAVNELYARHGFIFKSSDLKAHFEKFSWYHPVSSDANDAIAQMNSYEKQNLDAMGGYYNQLK